MAHGDGTDGEFEKASEVRQMTRGDCKLPKNNKIAQIITLGRSKQWVVFNLQRMPLGMNLLASELIVSSDELVGLLGLLTR
jgi:hypothetical protein